MSLPTADEQWMLELVNRIRVDPSHELSRLFSSLNPLTAIDADVQDAIDYFGVSSSVLQSNFAALTAVQAVGWDSGVADAAAAHNDLMISTDTQSHNLPGEDALLTRVQAQTDNYVSYVGENVYLYGYSIEYSHAGYVIDWGYGPGGIQDPAGHLLNMTESEFNLVGIDIGTSQSAEVSSTQDFIRSDDAGPLVLGVVFDDNNGNGFYEAGEGLSGVTVTVNGVATTSWSSGGYQIEPTAGGTLTVSFSGGGLSETVSTTITLSGDNRKVDLALSGDGNTPTILVRDDGDYGGDDTELRGGDTDTGAGGNDTVGTDGNDDLVLTDGDDIVRGEAGNDTIAGLGGADLIYGNTGSDVVYGNTGNDTVFGGQQADILFGGQNEDLLYGNYDTDGIYGNYGNDTLYGGQGNDPLFGGQGDDLLFGNRDDDDLFGNLGNDTLYGGSGADYFYAGDGQGDDVVADFNAAEGDRIVLASDYSLSGSGGSTVLTMSGASVTLLGIDVAGFDAATSVLLVA